MAITDETRTTPTASEIYVPEVNHFHAQIASTYNNFLDHLEPPNTARIYIPESFQGDWGSVSAIDYYTHLLSVYGFDNGGQHISAEDVTSLIEKIRDIRESSRHLFDTVQEAYDIYNRYVRESELPEFKIDINDLFFLPNYRYEEVSGAKTNLGNTLPQCHGPGQVPANEIVVPIDTRFTQDKYELLQTLVHELVHKGRFTAGLDKAFLENPLQCWLLEGLANSMAISMLETEKKPVSGLKSVYRDEMYFTALLRNKVQLASFDALSFEAIAYSFDLMEGRVGAFDEFAGDVFISLTYLYEDATEALNNKVDEGRGLGTGEQEKKELIEKWRLSE